jgi:hypothetical protein
MKFFTDRAALVCAGLAFALFASPVAAQQTTPDQNQAPAQQSAPGVPPAPPPDMRSSSSEALPPFPPMSARPRHRWVKVGSSRNTHAATARSSRKQATASVHRKLKARPTAKRKSEAVKTLTKAELRRCKRLTHRQLLRNRKCEAALRTKETKTAKADKHPAKAMSKAELRRCHNMNYRQLLSHRDCAAQLQRELNATTHAKHRSAPKARKHQAKKRRRS